ncbi:MAG: 16S rRNA (adenine(1518)-N(6)/adenine(1519)-N(6))-dimethyltransferase RsmA [Candidatus Hydrothermarchaeaceae archaeon]
MSLLRDTKLLLKRHEIKLNRRLGQNFIVDGEVLNREISHAGIKISDTVLEIGPGIGTLTERLIECAGKVYVVEMDARMIEVLKSRFKDRVKIIEGDFLKVDLPKFDKTISNIPYSISSPLTFRLLSRKFKTAVLTYQKEFAERMVAKPGEKSYSRLSVATYYWATAEIMEVLPPESFYPMPRVDSAIVRLTPKKKRPFEVSEKLFFSLIRGLFSHKKKILKKALFFSLSDVFGIKSKSRRLEILGTLPDEIGERRVFTLSPEELSELSLMLEEKL